MDVYQSIDNVDNDPEFITQQSAPRKQIRATTTWHTKPHATNLSEWIARHDLGPLDMYEPQPDSVDRGPIPYHPIWKENVFVLTHMLVPLAIQYYVINYTNFRWNTYTGIVVQFHLYQLWFVAFGIRVLHRAQYYMQKYGTLNEHKRGRDLIPDNHRTRVSYALVIFDFLRNIGVFYLGKDRTASPFFSVWSPIKIGVWLIALDYFFYLYHRASHEIDALWFIHRQHHATKSPTPQMSLWADNIQDFLEWALIPFLASKVMPLHFAELWLASGYLLYVEALGHSGIRAYWPHCILTPVLRPFGMELAVEDHDLHHRYGRSGKNYGKQTKIFDVIFGTTAPREEEKIYAEYLAKKNQGKHLNGTLNGHANGHA